MFESPASILYDVNGVAMAVTGGAAVPAGTTALVFAGMTPAGTASYLQTDAQGRLVISGTVSTTLAGGTLDQGNAGSQAQGWYVRITDGTNLLGTGSAFPFYITGTVGISGIPTVTGSVSVLNTVTITGSASVLNTVTVTGSVGISGIPTVTGSVSVLNTVIQKTANATTATLSNVAASATSVTLLASNSARRAATIYNDSTQKLYVKLGATASTTSFTVILFAQSFMDVPGYYQGIIDGIWSSANGSARVTEIT